METKETGRKKTKFFSKAFLLGDEEKQIISNRIIDHRRWTVVHEEIFKFGGHFYKTHYSVGATENQFEGPYEYDDDQIECEEVEPVLKLETAYETIFEDNEITAEEDVNKALTQAEKTGKAVIKVERCDDLTIDMCKLIKAINFFLSKENIEVVYIEYISLYKDEIELALELVEVKEG